jgi:tetratricopeptide (TPR) repeat protein
MSFGTAQGELAARPPAAARGPGVRTRLSRGAFLAMVTLAAYLPVMRAGYVWDDGLYVRENPMLRSVDGLRQIWFEPRRSPQYYPLVFTSFWLESRLWGIAPGGYHFTNVCLHGVNAILVWLLLRRLRVGGAFFAGLIFALHPVHVESVAWIAERKDVLSGTFYLLTLMLWLRYLERRTWHGYAMVLLLCAGAMLSKTTAAVLPVAMLLLAWWTRDTAWRRLIGLLLPFATLAAGLGLVTVWRENLHAPATTSLSFVERTLLAGRALWFYAGKLVWPENLMTMYPRWSVDATAAGQYGWLLAAVCVPLVLWQFRQRLGRGPLVAVLFFWLNLAPALGWKDFRFMQFSYVADHFQYLASIGPIALFAAVVARGAALLGSPRRGILYVADGLVVATLAALTVQQASLYKDEGTLWRDNLGKNPQAWGAHLYLATFLKTQGRLDEALRHFDEAARLKPDDALVQSIIGVFLTERGMLGGAVAHLSRAVEIDPNDAEAHYNLGTVLLRQGERAEAVRQFVAAIALRPDLARAHNDLGVIFFQQGKVEEAIQQLQTAVQIDPSYAEAHNDLGIALNAAGQLNEAIEQYRSALRFKPDYREAQQNLAQALAQQQGDARERVGD